MSRQLRYLVTLAVLLAGGGALAFVRSTSTPGHPETGVCLWWGKRQVTYVVNASLSSPFPCGDAASAVAEVQSILPAWGRTCTDFRFVNGGTSTKTDVADDGTNLIVFRSGACFVPGSTLISPTDPCRGTPGACAAKFNCWEHDPAIGGVGTLALTTTHFDAQTGEITDADVELHGWDGKLVPAYGAYYTCLPPSAAKCSGSGYGQQDCTSIDVGTIVLHEAGHMLGLAHVCDRSFAPPYDACPAGPTTPVMAPTGTPGEVKRLLSDDDASGICTLYPAGRPTVKCVADTVPSSTPKSGGCGAGPAGGSALALLALLALARTARRRRAPARP